MNTPKLRFKEFTDEWKENKLHDIAKITMGQSPNSENYTYDSSDTLLIQGNADLYNGKVIPRLFTKKITKTCDKEDIIMTVRAPVGDIAISDYYACIGRGVCSIKSSKFIYHYLDYLKEKGYWKKISKGSTIDSITSDNIKSLIIKTPSKKELEKIIRTIDLINKKIELQTRKIKALKLFKKGLNQRMFSKIGKMKSISQYVEEYINKTIVNNQYPILSSTFNGIVIQNEYFNKQAASSKNIGYKIVPRNYITYRSMSDTGEFHFNIQDKVDIGIVSPAYPVFRINNINANYFLNYINESYDFKMQIISIKEGGTRYALGFNKFKKLKIKIIDDDEFYGDFIKKLNEYLLLEDKKLDDLNKLKKGLLQNMFV